MENKLLIDRLVERNALDKDTAQKVLQESYYAKRRAEDILFERRLVKEDVIGEIKSKTLGIPYKKVQAKDIEEDVLKLIPEETVRNYYTVPLGKKDSTLIVGMVHPDDSKAQDALKFIAKQLRMNLGIYIIPMSLWEDMLRRYSPYRSEVSEAVKAITGYSSKKFDPASKAVQLEAGSSGDEAPIIRIVASTLKEAVLQQSSDVHIEPQRNRLRIRFRLDGSLKEIASMPIELHQPIVSRIKVLSNLKIDETRIPQDGRFRSVLMGRDIDFRVATFPTPVGEKVAIRVLDPLIGLKGLQELGMIGSNKERIEKAVKKPYGMILITGPTGSGKTTTLYALMQELNDEESNIVSLEDPVEYYMDGLNQSQVHPEIGYDFASGLRQILRQDPDTIMIGEIRDQETAGLSVHAALTGHIVLATLHTNNAIGVIPRLIDMGVPIYLLPSSLTFMVAQRLIPRLCQECKEEKDVDPSVREEVEKELSYVSEEEKKKLGLDKGWRSYESKGCSACNGKGISGRIALFEVLEMTRGLEDLISQKGLDEAALIKEARDQKMVTMRQDGIAKASAGLVSIESVLRETEQL